MHNLSQAEGKVDDYFVILLTLEADFAGFFFFADSSTFLADSARISFTNF
jgi:hypothetical protein